MVEYPVQQVDDVIGPRESLVQRAALGRDGVHGLRVCPHVLQLQQPGLHFSAFEIAVVQDCHQILLGLEECLLGDGIDRRFCYILLVCPVNDAVAIEIDVA